MLLIPASETTVPPEKKWPTNGMGWNYLLAQDDNLLRFLSELLPQPLDLIFHVHHLAWSMKHRDSPGFLHLFPQLHQLLQTNVGLMVINTPYPRTYLPGIKNCNTALIIQCNNVLLRSPIFTTESSIGWSNIIEHKTLCMVKYYLLIK